MVSEPTGTPNHVCHKTMTLAVITCEEVYTRFILIHQEVPRERMLQVVLGWGPMNKGAAEIKKSRQWYTFLNAHVHILVNFVLPPPISGCGRSVADFCGWGAHRAQLRCSGDVIDMYERGGVPGGALNLNYTGYPDHGRYGELPLQEEILTAEPGIEPGTSWLVDRSSDHQATRQVIMTYHWIKRRQVSGTHNTPYSWTKK
jgi:hypothetical protein